MVRGSRLWFAAVATALLLGACGGGGGGGGGGGLGGGGAGGPTGSAAGTVAFFGGLGVALEAEPNDTLGQVHPVGSVTAGRPLTILGHVDAEGGDPFDGFRVRVPQRSALTATISYASAAGQQFALEVYDPTALQVVESVPVLGTPTSLVLPSKGVLDLVLHATTGATNYQIALSVTPVVAPIAEQEPNQSAGDELYLGEVVRGDVVAFQGFADAAGDALDAILVACPAAEKLDLSLAFPAFQDFDIAVLDATASLSTPTPLATFATHSTNPETGSLAITAGKLLRIEVRAFLGSGAYTLTLRGLAPTATTLSLSDERPMVPRPAPIEAEGERAGRAGGSFYGHVTEPMVAGDVLVRFRGGYEAEGREDVTARAGRVTSESPSGLVRVHFDAIDAAQSLSTEDGARLTISRVAALLGSDAVELVAPNYVRRATAQTPNDTYYNLQWNLPQIHAPEAWDLTAGSGSVVVAVIDTGRTNHPDVAGRFTSGYDFISDPTNGDGNGRDADPSDVQSPWSDSVFHGTACASILGAMTGNGSGLAGVSWNGAIMPLRVLDNTGTGSDADIVEAVYYAARLANASGTLPPQKADVISMSLGGGGPSSVFQQAVTDARAQGCVVVAASGNSNTSSPEYPASYTGVISVGAVGYTKSRAPYSNYGSSLDLMAPGGDMNVDANFDGYADGVLCASLDSGLAPYYVFLEGTSMACPHVAAVAALIRAADPSLTVSQVESILFSTAEDLGAAGRDNTYGYGLVNAYAAVLAALPSGGPTPGPGPGPTSPPVLSVLPESVLIDSISTSADAGIMNLGGSLLTVGPVTASSDSGGAWLTASATGPADASKSASFIHMAVNRSGLPIGTYFGTVNVGSNGGSAVVRVAMSVGLAQPPPPDLFIRVHAIRADTGADVQQVSVNPTTSLSFFFAALPTGSYYFRATTDLDGDGVECEEGDYCGGYPIASHPDPVAIIAGTATTAIDFSVSPAAAFAASAGH
jgi:subtilisin family serine protease